MSRLRELIAELCPDGVEFVALEDIAVYENSRIDYSELNATNYVGVDNLLQDRAGKINSQHVPQKGKAIAFMKEDILIGNIRPYLRKIWFATIDGGTNGDVLAINVFDRKRVLPKYLYHVLSSDNFFIYDMKHSKCGTMPRGSKQAVMKYRFPIPPLEVQAEIVRILDKWSDANTGLIALLTRELDLRRQQYEYYRNKLLTFGDDVRRITLGQIGKVCMCKRILKHQTQPDGEIPFYKIGTFGGRPDAYISRDLFERLKNNYPYPKKGYVLISAAGTIGKLVIFNGDDAYFQDSNIVWIDNDESQVLNKFLYYVYHTEPWEVTKGGTIKRLYNDNIAKAIIPVPPLEIQHRISEILGRFETLCSDLTHGLPAEISARRKQYEYYRDKLLTFIPKEKN